MDSCIGTVSTPQYNFFNNNGEFVTHCRGIWFEEYNQIPDDDEREYKRVCDFN